MRKINALQPPRQTGIRLRIFGYLCLFVVMLLVILWLLQVVFLRDIYEHIKIQTLRTTADTIVRNAGSGQFDQLLNQLAREGQMGILMIDEQGQQLYLANGDPFSQLHHTSPEQRTALWQATKEAGGTFFERTRDNDQPRPEWVEEWVLPEGMDRWPRTPRNPLEIMLLCRQVTLEGQPALVMISTAITPVHATVQTLMTQLKWLTVAMLLMAAGLAFVMARRVSRPLEQIERSARQLATGDYEVHFSEGAYREVSQLARTLNYAAQELSTVERLRRELVANVSHDLRTPLTMITGYTEAMRDLPGENTPENLQIIIDEARRLTDLVNDLLDLSRLQAGAQTLHLEDFSLTEQVQHTMRRYAKLMAQEGYLITFEYEGDQWVRADPLKISQVLYNLMNNAINYTGPDKRVRVVQELKDGRVRLSVIDTGAGIAPEDLPYIWERYYKVDKTHRRGAVGTGLGLSIVRAVLQAHGAQYGVESDPQAGGSCFWFSLPQVPGPGPV